MEEVNPERWNVVTKRVHKIPEPDGTWRSAGLCLCTAQALAGTVLFQPLLDGREIFRRGKKVGLAFLCIAWKLS